MLSKLKNDHEALLRRAQNVRRNTLTSIYHAKSGHPGGSLSCVDILTVLYEMKCVQDSNLGGLVHVILSKGHAAPALYAVAVEYQILPQDSLLGFRKINSILQGHPHIGSTPWVEASTGSLGQGFSVAMGMALGYKHQNKSDHVYAILGDGELQEGEIWEAAMSAAHFGLGNLCAIIDYNKMQSDDLNKNIMNLEGLSAKWKAFNWEVIEIDGHDIPSIQVALSESKKVLHVPTVIIAHTVKGCGVSFMANKPSWHGSVTLRKDELELALLDLGVMDENLHLYISGDIWSKTI